MSDQFEVVTVFSTGSLALLAYAKSVLDSAGIMYVVKGEQIQNMFGLGSLGSFNFTLGPMEIQVNLADESSARELLAGIKESEGEGI